MIRVIGLDYSLASTGLIDLRIGPAGTTWRVYRFKTTPGRSLAANYQRMLQQAERIYDVVVPVVPPLALPDLVMVEGPAYGSSTPGQHELSGGWWHAAGPLAHAGLRVVQSTPHQVKIYACGTAATSGPNRATKAKVAEGILAAGRYPLDLRQQLDAAGGSDVIDATSLAAMGARLLGHPVEGTTLPATHLRALDKHRPKFTERTPTPCP